MGNQSGGLLLKVQAVSLAFHIQKKKKNPAFKAMSQASRCLTSRKVTSRLVSRPFDLRNVSYLVSCLSFCVFTWGSASPEPRNCVTCKILSHVSFQVN